MPYEYREFKDDILKYTGIDLNSYKEEQMKRRIDSLILRKSYIDYKNYFRLISEDSAVCDEFLGYMTINVSEFFRNPDQWRILETDFLPDLISRCKGNINIWSAACSTGDEPYSLVMLLSRYLPLEKIKVFATDIDAHILAKAKAGLYSASSIQNVPSDLRQRYFIDCGMGTYQISKSVIDRVVFCQHNLLADEYPKNMDLIVCRNVLIYFTEEAKNEVYRKFYDSMNHKSVLFIGTTEQVIRYREIGFSIYKSFFYKKG
ncbi:MAG TPA: chemotaxis protein CheR [Eubacterium sp.]|nr:chemotaxis protein CheR [Eubacterium sp.]